MGGAPAIVTVRPGVQFVPPAADSFRRLEARLGRRADVNRTYADWDTQLKMYNAWQAYVTGRGPKPNHSRALHPSKSAHCAGLAWDSDDWRTPGFISLAAEYGFIRTAANDPTEQHHFEYQWWRDSHRNEPVPSGGSAKPNHPTPPPPPLEDDDMLMLKIKGIGTGAHYAALGPGIFRHFIAADPYELIMKVSRIQDDWQEIPASALPALLRTYGCDLHIWDWRNGQFVVLDPLTGTSAPGNVWTAVNAARSSIDNVKLVSAETKAYLAELAEAK